MEYQRDHHASEAGLVQGLRKDDLELEAQDPKKKTKYEEEDEEKEEEKEEKENLGLEEELSVERIFEKQAVPSWKEQLTVRAFFISLVLSVLFSVIVMKLNLTTGIIPSLNVSAGLLGFFFVRTWTKFLDRCGLLKQPFTRQENTVIQTCVVASSGIAFSGGFGSYLFGMSARIARQSADSSTSDIKEPGLLWFIGFLFVVSFLGLFSVVPLRKIMIIDFKLTYPSGTATAHLINSFHTPQGAKLAKKQVKELGKFFSFSFLWGFFQWFYTAGSDCGFASFPTLGLKAYQNQFFFDFSATYVGVGMICPYIVNISVLLGGILSWGLMWPLIENRSGDWYSKELSPKSMNGLQGYKVFIAIAMILGDGLYNFLKVLSRTLIALQSQLRAKDVNNILPIEDQVSPAVTSALSYDDQRRTQLFLKDQIPAWFAVGGYVAIAAVSIATVPTYFPNSNGTIYWSSTSLRPAWLSVAIFMIGAWAGSAHGGVLAGLAACGVMMNIVSTASDLTQDFKTGYLTLASPRSMFVSQVIGTAMGCVISPCVFWLFYKAFTDLGTPKSAYPAPLAVVYRNMAILGVEGFKSLPKHCLLLCTVFFGAAILTNVIKDCIGKKRARFVPLPMAMAIPFYLGSYFAIDMCIGSLIVFLWERVNKAKADAFVPAVASGLICGDGVWTLPASILLLPGLSHQFA
ncbi:YELLOW STRIPE like 3 [Prunus dulcis]|uniref:YELLOW STRIPE like 3 n=1 Tax=Prunus dulcis TaxID=3755 RepID=A0A4Y1RK45_PRUDU|nr:YELLOW STRIPE like 3 [Prunus dulcis]